MGLVNSLKSNSYALSQNYGAAHIVATLSYNIPVSKVETLLPLRRFGVICSCCK